MAYQVLETNLLQSALKAASQVTAALISVGDSDATTDPEGVLISYTDTLFDKLKVTAEEDNKRLRDEDNASPAPRGGGGKRGGGGGNKALDPVEAGQLELKWGAFKGHTIEEVYKMSKADVNKAGIAYEKDGETWLKWVAKSDNEFVARRAKAFLDAQ